MRSSVGAFLVVVLSVVVSGPAAVAEIGDHTGGAGAGAGGVIVGGTPVAIAVTSPSGTLGSYVRRGARSGPRWTCSYYRMENGSSSGVSVAVDYSTGPVDPVRGEVYLLVCLDEHRQVVHTWLGIYDPGDPFSGLLAAERAAELAVERLDLPPPDLGFSPPGDLLVGLPTWLWVDTAWDAASAVATVTDVTSAVSARPLSVRWDLGDGTAIACEGPGTPYDAARPADAQASTCSHVYQRSSAAQPDGSYAVTATVTYAITWEATTGESGDLGTVERSTTASRRVVEVQAVID